MREKDIKIEKNVDSNTIKINRIVKSMSQCMPVCIYKEFKNLR